jgi:serine/threonine protein kinase
MKSKDKELVTTEIEILKICQHPNIIRLYDIFENFEYIFIGKKNNNIKYNIFYNEYKYINLI